MASNNLTSCSSAAPADNASSDYEAWASGLGELPPVWQYTQESQANHTSTPYLSPGQPDFLQNNPPNSASTGANVPFNPVDSNDFTGFGSLESGSLQLQNNVVGNVADAAIDSQWMPQQLPAQQQQPEQQHQVPLREQQLSSQMGPLDFSLDSFNFDLDSNEWSQDSCMPDALASFETSFGLANCAINDIQDILVDQEVQQQQQRQQPTRILSAEQTSTQQVDTLPDSDMESLFGSDEAVPSGEESQPQTINMDSLMIHSYDVQLPMSLLHSLDSYNQEIESVQSQPEPTSQLQDQPQRNPPAAQTLLPMPSQPMSPVAAATQLPSPTEGEQPSQHQGQLVGINGQPTTPAEFQDLMMLDYETNVPGCVNTNNTTQLGAAQQPTPDSSSAVSPSSPDATTTPKKAKRTGKGKGKGKGVTTTTGTQQAEPNFDASNALGPQSPGRVEKEKKRLGRDSCQKCRKDKTKCIRENPNGPCKHCVNKGSTCVTTGGDSRTHKTLRAKYSAMIDHYTMLAREVCAQLLCYESSELRAELFSRNTTTGNPSLPVGAWLHVQRDSDLSVEGIPRTFLFLEQRRAIPANKLAKLRALLTEIENDCKIFLGSLLYCSDGVQRGTLNTGPICDQIRSFHGWPVDYVYFQNDREATTKDAAERLQREYSSKVPEPILPEAWHAKFKAADQDPSTPIEL